MRSKWVKWIREWVFIIVVGFIMALIIQKTAFALYIVEGHSMEPTLHNHERVFVNRIPLYFGHLDRGDVVVFPNPVDGRNFVKRIIGLPGDVVEVKDGQVYLNNQPLHETYIDTITAEGSTKTVVETGHVFVMGDNRHPGASWDSRAPEIGQIPISDIVGEAEFVVFPLPHQITK